jgi:sucrose-phosphate synthase
MARDQELQDAANLVIVAGNREDIRELDDGAQSVPDEILLLIDRYDLYGKVAYPRQHRRMTCRSSTASPRSRAESS